MKNYIEEYCHTNNFGKDKLQKLVDKIIKSKFGWIPQKDMDDFYSIGYQVLWSCQKRYKENRQASFETYLIFCLKNKIKQHVTYMNRDKRQPRDNEGNVTNVISIDSSISHDNDDYTIADTIKDERIDIENNLIKEELSDKMEYYLSRLSKLQKSILELMACNYKPGEIKAILHISNKQYNDSYSAITAYRNIEILF